MKNHMHNVFIYLCILFINFQANELNQITNNVPFLYQPDTLFRQTLKYVLDVAHDGSEAYAAELAKVLCDVNLGCHFSSCFHEFELEFDKKKYKFAYLTMDLLGKSSMWICQNNDSKELVFFRVKHENSNNINPKIDWNQFYNRRVQSISHDQAPRQIFFISRNNLLHSPILKNGEISVCRGVGSVLYLGYDKGSVGSHVLVINLQNNSIIRTLQLCDYAPQHMVEVAPEKLLAWNGTNAFFVKAEEFRFPPNVMFYPKPTNASYADPFVSFDGKYTGIITDDEILIFDNSDPFKGSKDTINQKCAIATFMPENSDLIFMRSFEGAGYLYSISQKKIEYIFDLPKEKEITSFAYPSKNILRAKIMNMAFGIFLFLKQGNTRRINFWDTRDSSERLAN